MDAYQPIYDAVRSRISNADIGSAVERAMQEANIGHSFSMAAEAFRCAAFEMERPCVVFKPRIAQDGDRWIAVLGDDLQTGVVGIGDTPSAAMRAFDIAWTATTPTESA